MAGSNLLIIADDLSGAADCAIRFAAKGRHTVVVLDGDDGSTSVAAANASGARIDVIAADIDTRRVTGAAAGARAVATYHRLGGASRRLCKKIDSTLRGNWAAEVAALQAVAGMAIVAPAFPATGRVVENAEVLVHGVPLAETDTWQLEHAGQPANLEIMLSNAGLRCSRIDVASLRAAAASPALDFLESARERHIQAVIVDAQTEEDLAALARMTCRWQWPHFWVGSGGLARELADLPDDAGLFDAPIAPQPAVAAPVGPTLALVGSLSAISDAQCEMLREQAGMPEWTVPPAMLRETDRHPEWSAWQDRIAAHLADSGDLLLRIGRDASFDPGEGAALSAGLARLIAPSFPSLGGLIATGGETARAMLVAAGIGRLQLIDEVEPGVAVGRPDSSHAARPGIVTKAGAFGAKHALLGAYHYLEKLKAPGAIGLAHGLEPMSGVPGTSTTLAAASTANAASSHTATTEKNPS